MKGLLIAVAFFMIALKAFSQDMEGEWIGSFIDFTSGSATRYSKTKISFFFIKINDSTFQSFSKTFIKEKDTIDSSVCVMRGGFSKRNILYLEEINPIQRFSGDTDTSTACLQFMKLYYYSKKNQLKLSGNWYTDENKCGYGDIILTKKKSEK